MPWGSPTGKLEILSEHHGPISRTSQSCVLQVLMGSGSLVTWSWGPPPEFSWAVWVSPARKPL